MSAQQQEPEWFKRAIASEPAHDEVIVEGCKVHFATWGEVGKPGIILIHGSNAHLEWWRFVAPFLSDQFRVASMDLSGHGDSGWRDRYTGEIFAKEVMAVCEAADLGEKPFVVAHSFGGFVALETGHLFGDALGGIVFGDFTVKPPEDYVEWGKKFAERGSEPARATRIYEELDTALARFRLVPEQPCQHPYVLSYLARKSLHQVEGGWTWKFDPALFDHLEMGEAQRDKFLGISCPTALILGEHSSDSGAQSAGYIDQISNGLLPMFVIPATHHHFMFDEPMATVTAIKAILLGWRREANADELSGLFQAMLEK